MEQDMKWSVIARIHTDFSTKFGIPRQSGLVEECEGRIVFEPEYRNVDAVRGLEEFSYIWAIWQFSEAVRNTWSATVRPPRLGGNTRVGVFATRSPFRPNALGLSCLKLKKIRMEEEGPVLIVAGVDMMDGTPIFDIKPYLPLADSKPFAKGGFTDKLKEESLEVKLLTDWPLDFKQEKREALIKALSLDPRPSYHEDPTRVYGMEFAGYHIKFRVFEGAVFVLLIQQI